MAAWNIPTGRRVMEDAFDSHEEKRTMQPSFVFPKTPPASPQDAPAALLRDRLADTVSMFPTLSFGSLEREQSRMQVTGERGRNADVPGESCPPGSGRSVVDSTRRSMVVRPEVPMREAKRAACTHPAVTAQGLGDHWGDRRRGAPR